MLQYRPPVSFPDTPVARRHRALRRRRSASPEPPYLLIPQRVAADNSTWTRGRRLARIGSRAACAANGTPFAIREAGAAGRAMKPSAFNVRVPLAGGEVFLMNTLTDAQAVVSSDVVALLDRLDAGGAADAVPEPGRARNARDAGKRRVPRPPSRIRARGAGVVLRDVPRGHVPVAHHDPHHPSVQLRLRLLLPGRARRFRRAGREDVD